jgi:hypothetical protein
MKKWKIVYKPVGDLSSSRNVTADRVKVDNGAAMFFKIEKDGNSTLVLLINMYNVEKIELETNP